MKILDLFVSEMFLCMHLSNLCYCHKTIQKETFMLNYINWYEKKSHICTAEEHRTSQQLYGGERLSQYWINCISLISIIYHGWPLDAIYHMDISRKLYDKVIRSSLCYRLLLADDGGWGDEGCEELALLTCRVLFLFGDESGVDALAGELLANPWSLSLRRASSATVDDSEVEEWGLVLDSNISSGKLNSVSSFGKGRLSRSSNAWRL